MSRELPVRSTLYVFKSRCQLSNYFYACSVYTPVLPSALPCLTCLDAAMSVVDISSGSKDARRPIILVTGANAGVGFGICQRLIVQLSSSTPSDTLPFNPKRNTDPDVHPHPTPFAASHGCTIVLACRNPIKAHQARQQLKQLLEWIENLPEHEDTPSGPPESWAYAFNSKDGKLVDPMTTDDLRDTPHEDADPALVAHAQENTVRRRRKLRKAMATDGEDASSGSEVESLLNDDAQPDLNASVEQRTKRANAKYRRRFCRGTKIEFVPLDLGSMASAVECARLVRNRYPYLTHLVLNAGSSSWIGMNYFHATWMMMTSFRHAVTWPAYKLQRAGDKSDDGFGWVWQCNVGAHYILVKALLPALQATPYSVASRIIWTSSLEAFSKYYDSTDFQCIDAKKSLLPYESTKYQCELAAFGLDNELQRGSVTADDGEGLKPRSYLCHPGVVASSMMSQFVQSWVTIFVIATFYLARWFGSPHHPIDAFKGAISVTYACLAPQEKMNGKKRHGSRCDFWGREYVGIEDIEYYRHHLGGAGPGVAAQLALARVDPESVAEDEETREEVASMAKKFIGYCEQVAKQVWDGAKQDHVPNWTSLSDQRLDQNAAKRQSSISQGAKTELDSNDARPPSGGDPAVTVKKTTVPTDTYNDEAEWEKVH